MNAEAPAHILIVDDDARIRTLLSRYLARNGYLTTVAQDAAQARRLLGGLSFDLLVVDVMMPGESGLELTRAMRRQIAAPIVMLTARSETNERIAGLESGADDYVSKPFEPRELLLRIAAILRRAAPIPEEETKPRVLGLGPSRYDVSRGELWRDGALVRLTGTEASLLRALSATPNAPVSRLDLLSALRGSEDDVSERAVDVQITRLRRKIERDPRSPRYLQTVRGEGYMLTPDLAG